MPRAYKYRDPEAIHRPKTLEADGRSQMHFRESEDLGLALRTHAIRLGVNAGVLIGDLLRLCLLNGEGGVASPAPPPDRTPGYLAALRRMLRR